MKKLSVLLLVAALSCRDNPTEVKVLTITPSSVNLYLGQTQQFVCSTSCIWPTKAPNGLYTATRVGQDTITPCRTDDPTICAHAVIAVTSGITSVSTLPTAPTVLVNDTLRFTATVTGPNPNHTVNWNARRGTIDQTGLYHAPSTPTVDTVWATSAVDVSKSAAATPTIIFGIVLISVSPTSATMFVNDTLRFTATVTGPNPNHTVNWNARRGTIDQTGLYHAPSTPTVDTVWATSAVDVSYSATAQVAVSLSTPKLLWARFLDWGTMRDFADAVAVSQSNNIIVGGWSNPLGTSNINSAFAGYDADGNKLWTSGPIPLLGIGSGFVANDAGTEFFFTGGYGPATSTKTACGAIGSSGAITVDPSTDTLPGNGAGNIRRLGNELYIANGRSGNVLVTDLSCRLVKTLTVTTRPGSRISGLWVTQDHILTSGDFPDNSAVYGGTAFIRKSDPNGNLICEKIYQSAVNTYVVEDAQGRIYAGGTDETTGQLLLYMAVLDQNCRETVPRIFWNGDNPQSDNLSNYTTNLVLNPKGGVVLLMQLEELPGNPFCTTAPNCWDFGAWAVGPDGKTVWTIRQDPNHSPWNFAQGAAFDSANNLILVGRSTPNPTGNDATDNVDWAILKFSIP